MGSRGFPKKAQLHAVKGAADQKQRRDFRPEAPAAYHPEEPDWKVLVGGRDKRVWDDAHAEWALTVLDLSRSGMLARTDVAAAVDYCICHARVLQCERKMSSKGLLVKGANGQVKNPIAPELNHWSQRLQRLRSDFGLTPMARMRLGREDEVPPDDDSDLNDAPPV